MHSALNLPYILVYFRGDLVLMALNLPYNTTGIILFQVALSLPYMYREDLVEVNSAQIQLYRDNLVPRCH